MFELGYELWLVSGKLNLNDSDDTCTDFVINSQSSRVLVNLILQRLHIIYFIRGINLYGGNTYSSVYSLVESLLSPYSPSYSFHV